VEGHEVNTAAATTAQITGTSVSTEYIKIYAGETEVKRELQEINIGSSRATAERNQMVGGRS
jgi:hypothetical protein